MSLVHNFLVGLTIQGFTVVENEYISETDTQLIKLVHGPSGLTVFKHIPRDTSYTENSANIAFATFASDDKGLPHITEHSVFCGSELYPHKDPFNEITKTSLKVYNNAFTAQTHTTYEFASRCKRDYLNILSVYLDAVFRPALLEDPRIYAQEGWHLHLEKEEGEIVQSGIVLNEMKSRCASPSSILIYNLQRLLYGGTVMGYETGGLPEAIVTGTHADIVEFYKRFYHPGNCIISFYGNIPLEDELHAVADQYLVDYDCGDRQQVKCPPPIPTLYRYQQDSARPSDNDAAGSVRVLNHSSRRVRFVEYGVSKETKALKKEGVIGRIYHLFDLRDATPLLLLSVRVLDYILFDQTSSPVPEHLQSSLLCKSCYSMLDYNELQCTLYLSFLGCEHTEEGYLALISAYEDLLTELISSDKDGQYYRFLSPQAIGAALNHIELEYRDISPNYGLAVNNRTISAALAGCPSSTRLRYEEPLQELRKMIADDTITEYLCSVLAKYFTSLNPSQADVVLVPIPGYLDRCEEETRKQLRALKESLSPDDIQRLVASTQEQIRRALEPTPQEINELLPVLRLEDIDAVNTDMLKAQSFLHYDLRKSPHLMPILYCHTGEQGRGMSYLNICIDVTEMCDLETLPFFSLLANHILGEVATTSYKTVESLHRAIDYYTGSLSISLEAEDVPPFLRDSKRPVPQSYKSMPSRIYINIKATCKDDNTEAVMRIIFHEILGGSSVGLTNPRVLLRLLHEFWMSLREDIVEGDGHLVASRRASALCGRLTSFVYELASGPSMYNWLSKLLRDTLVDHNSRGNSPGDSTMAAEEEICHSDNSFEGDDNEDEDDAFLDNDSTKQELCLLGERLAALLAKISSRPDLFLVCVGQRISELTPYVAKTRYNSGELSKIYSILAHHPFNDALLHVVNESYSLRPGKLSIWVKRHNTCPLAEQFDRLLMWYRCEDQRLPLDIDLVEYSSVFNSLAIPSDVSYVARSYLPPLAENLTLERSYLSGNIPAKYLALHIIENVYLWDNVRIKNGAYGCMLKLRLNGSAVLFSYDDSRVVETIRIYNALFESAEQLYGGLDNRTLDSYKIGCLSANQIGISPKQIFRQAVHYFISGYSVRKHYREVRETLSVTKDALLKAHEYFSNLSTAPSVVVGSTSSCQDAFAKGLIRRYDIFE